MTAGRSTGRWCAACPITLGGLPPAAKVGIVNPLLERAGGQWSVNDTW